MRFQGIQHIDFGGHHNSESIENEVRGCGCILVLFSVLLVFALCLIGITGCADAEYITQEKPVYVHDTLSTIQTRIDSVFRDRDVIREIFTKGDTVYNNTIERIVERDIKELHDTVVKITEVPIEITKTEIKEVEKNLSWWQKTTMNIGRVCLIALAALLIYYFARARFGIS